MSNKIIIRWQVHIAWLEYGDKKQHNHRTKWRKTEKEAWEEAEAFKKTIKYYRIATFLDEKITGPKIEKETPEQDD